MVGVGHADRAQTGTSAGYDPADVHWRTQVRSATLQPMATLEIEVPETVQEQLRVWAAAGKICSEQEFLADLVVEAVDYLAVRELRALLDEGLRAPKILMRDVDWEAMRQRVEARAETRRAAKAQATRDKGTE
jgi:prophage tail gpP-like protein